MPGSFIFVNSSRRLQKSRIFGVISSLALAMKPTQFFAPITLIASDVISVCSIRTAPHLSKYSSRTLVLELTSLKILGQKLTCWVGQRIELWFRENFGWNSKDYLTRMKISAWHLFFLEVYFHIFEKFRLFSSLTRPYGLYGSFTSIRKSRRTVSTRLDFSTLDRVFLRYRNIFSFENIA